MSFDLRTAARESAAKRRLERALSEQQETLDDEEREFLDDVALPAVAASLGDWGTEDDVLVFEVAVRYAASPGLLASFAVISPANDPDLKLYVRKFDDDREAHVFLAVRQGNVWAPAHVHPLRSLAELGDLLNG